MKIEPLLLGLDAGELEVLLLARQIEPDWVIIDERLARRVAFAMGLPVKGTFRDVEVPDCACGGLFGRSRTGFYPQTLAILR